MSSIIYLYTLQLCFVLVCFTLFVRSCCCCQKIQVMGNFNDCRCHQRKTTTHAHTKRRIGWWWWWCCLPHSPYDLCTLVHLQFVVIGWLSRDASFCLLCMESDKGGVQGSFFGLRSIWPKNPQHKLNTHIIIWKTIVMKFRPFLLYYLTYFNTVISFNTFLNSCEESHIAAIHLSTYLYLSLNTPRISPFLYHWNSKREFWCPGWWGTMRWWWGRCFVMSVLMWSVHCLLKDKMPCCCRRRR